MARGKLPEIRSNKSLFSLPDYRTMASNIRITFFGTGGSWPTPLRGLPSVGIQVDDKLNLFDCGEGSQKQIMKSSTSFMKVENVFITHFHGDHFIGLIGMVQSMSFNGRSDPLNIYGPRGAIHMILNALNVGYFRLNFDVKITELDANRTYDFGEFTISTLPNDHPVPALSYCLEEKDLIRIDRQKAEDLAFPVRRLEELRQKGILEIDGRIYSIGDVSAGVRKGRKIVYTGDTRPMQSMVEFSRNADVLIHDTTTDSSLEPKVNEFGHTSAKQAAKIARDANVKRLYLFHYSPRVDDVNTLLTEAREIFPQTFASSDLAEFDVPVNRA
ncbi:Ribonuclease Z [Thermoplasmatales archaeon]|nr:Ribonuclease Z [Thermoplasmatales archaeon]